MTCLGAYLVAVSVLVSAGGPVAAELVGRLGASRFADREAAAGALRGLGRDALPALRAAFTSRDLEIRHRAARLAEEIQRDWLLTPTRLALDFQDQSVDRIVNTINGRNGTRLALLPIARRLAESQAPSGVTLQSNGSVTFWEAVDQLCDAAKLTPLPSNHTVPGCVEPTTYLMPRGPDEGESPHVADGLFRVTLESVTLDGNIHPGLRFGSGGRAQVSAQLLIEAEPRILAVEDGMCGWVEAIDDKGRSWVPPGYDKPRRNTVEGSMGFYATSSSAIGTGARFMIHAPLRDPGHAGGTLKRLRGIVPVLLTTREPGPLIVPLAEPRVSEVRDSRVRITIGSKTVTGASRFSTTEVDLTIRTLGEEPLNARLLPYQIEVLDANGIQFNITHSQIQLGAGQAQVHLNLIGMAKARTEDAQGRPPLEGKGSIQLRFFHLFQAPAEVAFAFENVPMP
jgi:hypothetical protein